MPEAEDADVRLGQLAYRAGFVTDSDLEEALLEQERRAEEGFQTKLGELMVSMGLVTERQLERLLGAQAVVHARVSRIGPYQLIAKLGEGGMGAVYQARDVRTGEFVALKVLPRSKARDPSFLARFEQEARAVFELDHPNIVRAVGMGEADGYHYLSMEYVDGKDVYDILEEKGRIPEHEALQIVIQIAQALEHAAEEQVVHRDIKPGNILVDRHGLAKLTDFGLALDRDRIGRGRITEGTEALGTPFYLSPELARSEQDIDVRSDIYSLGASLYEMVTGRPPFEGPPIVVMSKHLSEQIPSPSEFDRSLSPGICRVIQKMMAKRREDRYQTPRELLRDLMLVYQGADPLSAGLPSHKSSVRTSLRPPHRRLGRLRHRPAHEYRRVPPRAPGAPEVPDKLPDKLPGRRRAPRAPEPHAELPDKLHDRRPRQQAEARPASETQLVAPPVKHHPTIRAMLRHRRAILVGVAAAALTVLAAWVLMTLRPAPGAQSAAGNPKRGGAGRKLPGAQSAAGNPKRGGAGRKLPGAPSPGLVRERLILRSDFESGTTEGWRGAILSQGTGDGAYSLRVPSAAPPERGLVTRAPLPRSERLTVAFLYYLDGGGPIVVEVGERASGVRLRSVIEGPARNTWASASVAGSAFQRVSEAPARGAEDTGESISIGAPEAGPLNVLVLDSIRVWSE